MQRTARTGLGFGLVVAFVMLLAGALLWALFDPVVRDVFNWTSASGQPAAASRHQGIMRAIWVNFPFYVLFLGVLAVVAEAYFESEGGL